MDTEKEAGGIGVNLFDKFGRYYDKMIPWEKRLKNEAPFFHDIIMGKGIKTLLDVGCGTGHHAVMFANLGSEVTAVDPSPEMVEESIKRAISEDKKIEFKQLGIGQLHTLQIKFDMVTCLGNSLAHIRDKVALDQAFRDFYVSLAQNGVLVIQMRNYDKVFINEERFMPLNTYNDSTEEILFLRMTEFINERDINFSILVFHRNDDSDWQFECFSEPLAAWRRSDLIDIMTKVGFKKIKTFGSYKKDEWFEATSKDLIMVAEK